MDVFKPYEKKNIKGENKLGNGGSSSYFRQRTARRLERLQVLELGGARGGESRKKRVCVCILIFALRILKMSLNVGYIRKQLHPAHVQSPYKPRVYAAYYKCLLHYTHFT